MVEAGRVQVRTRRGVRGDESVTISWEEGVRVSEMRRVARRWCERQGVDLPVRYERRVSAATTLALVCEAYLADSGAVTEVVEVRRGLEARVHGEVHLSMETSAALRRVCEAQLARRGEVCLDEVSHPLEVSAEARALAEVVGALCEGDSLVARLPEVLELAVACLAGALTRE